jgi:hypothetical protein
LGHGISDKDSFSASAAGMLVLATAALAPFDALLWSHMVQHELLMVVAAPLLVLGRPMVAFARIVPVRLPRGLGEPLVAWALHALAVCAWHLPVLFVAATASEALHFAQHASFLANALLFWWMVFARRDLGALMALFATMLYTGALGRGRIGPPLERLAQRVYVAGRLANTPDNLIRWIRDPRGVDPQTAMPAVGLDEAGARDIAAYLYTR